MCKSFPPRPGPRQSPSTLPGGSDRPAPTAGYTTCPLCRIPIAPASLPQSHPKAIFPKPSALQQLLSKALLRSSLRSALLCHEMLHPKQRQRRERRGITPRTTVAVRAGTAAGKAAEARVCLHQLPFFGDWRQTGADKQKKTKMPSAL